MADDDHRSYIANEFVETSADCGDALAAVVIVVIGDFQTMLSVGVTSAIKVSMQYATKLALGWAFSYICKCH